MRYLLFLISLASTQIAAQSPLNFDKRFVESEDRWVAFDRGKDSSYVYGFIYIDGQAGLTLNYEGKFTISATGQFIPKKLDSTNVKYRLQPNNVLVAFIPESKYSELKITAIPEWLHYYKTDTNSVHRLYRWGYLYNSKATLILQDALLADPTDAYTNKELVYAQIKNGQLDKAAESCRKAIEVCKDQSYNGENCYNVLHSYYLKKDKANCVLWLDLAKKWTTKNAAMTKNIATMENEVNSWQ